MKVYISSHSIEVAQQLAKWFAHCGIQVVSTWHDGAYKPSSEMTTEEKQGIPDRNFPQIDSCDVLVLVSSLDKVPGGKFVEAGYAIGKGKRVIIYGHRENLVLWDRRIEETTRMSDLSDMIRGT